MLEMIQQAVGLGTTIFLVVKVMMFLEVMKVKTLFMVKLEMMF